MVSVSYRCEGCNTVFSTTDPPKRRLCISCRRKDRAYSVLLYLQEDIPRQILRELERVGAFLNDWELKEREIKEKKW